MRQTTMIWVELNNIGQPHDRQRFNGPLSEMIPKIALWLLSVTMGANIRITIARNQAELDIAVKRKVAGAEESDMMSQLEAMLAGNEGVGE
jgi:hypothetical protein